MSGMLHPSTQNYHRQEPERSLYNQPQPELSNCVTLPYGLVYQKILSKSTTSHSGVKHAENFLFKWIPLEYN